MGRGMVEVGMEASLVAEPVVVMAGVRVVGRLEGTMEDVVVCVVAGESERVGTALEAVVKVGAVIWETVVVVGLVPEMGKEE